MSALGAFGGLKAPCQLVMQYLSARLGKPYSAMHSLRSGAEVFEDLCSAIVRESDKSDFNACVDYILIPLNMLLPCSIPEKQSQLRLLADTPVDDTPLILDDRSTEAVLTCLLVLILTNSPSHFASDPTRLSALLLRVGTVLTDVRLPASQGQGAVVHDMSENTAAAATALLGVILCHMLGHDVPRSVLPSLPPPLPGAPKGAAAAASAPGPSSAQPMGSDSWTQLPQRTLQYLNSHMLSQCSSSGARVALPVLPPLCDTGPSGHLLSQLLQLAQTRTSASTARVPTKSESVHTRGRTGEPLHAPSTSDAPSSFLPTSVPAQLAAAAASCVHALVRVLAGPQPGNPPSMIMSYPEAFRPGPQRVAPFLPGLVSGLTSWLQPSQGRNAGAAPLNMAVATANVAALQATLLSVFSDCLPSGTASSAADGAHDRDTAEAQSMQLWVGAAEAAAARNKGSSMLQRNAAATTLTVAGKTPQEALQLATPRVVRVLLHCTLSKHLGLAKAGATLALSLLQDCSATLRSCEHGRALWLVALETAAAAALRSGTTLGSGWVSLQPPGESVQEAPPEGVSQTPSREATALQQFIGRGAAAPGDTCAALRSAFWEASAALASASQKSQASIRMLAQRMTSHVRLWCWLADHSGASLTPLIQPGEVVRLVTQLARALRSVDEVPAPTSAHGSEAAGTHMSDATDPVHDERFVPFGQRVPLPSTPFQFASLVEHDAIQATEELLLTLGWYAAHPTSGDIWIDLMEECVEGALLTHAAAFAGWVRARIAAALQPNAADEDTAAGNDAGEHSGSWGRKQDVMLWRRVLVADVPPAVNGKTVVPAHVANYTRAVLGTGAADSEASHHAEDDDSSCQLPPPVPTDNYVEAYRGVRQRLLLASSFLRGAAGVSLPLVAGLDTGRNAQQLGILHNEHRLQVIHACSEYIQGELLRETPAVDVSAALPCAALVRSAHLWHAPQATFGDMLASLSASSPNSTSGQFVSRGGFMDALVRDVLQGGAGATGLYAENPLPAQNGQRVDAARTHMSGTFAPLEIKLPVPLAVARVHRQTVAMGCALLGQGLALSGPTASNALARTLFPLVRGLTSPAYIVRHAVMQCLSSLAVTCSRLSEASPVPRALCFSPLCVAHETDAQALCHFSEHGVSTGLLLAHNAGHLLEPLSSMLRDLKSSTEAPGLLRAVVDLLADAPPSAGTQGSEAPPPSSQFRPLLNLAGRSILASLESSREDASTLAALLQGAAEFLAALERSATQVNNTNGALVFGLPASASTVSGEDLPDWAVTSDDKWRALRTSESEQTAFFGAIQACDSATLARMPDQLASGEFITAKTPAGPSAKRTPRQRTAGSVTACVPRLLARKEQDLVHKIMHTARHDFSSPHAHVVVAAGDVIVRAAVALRAVPGELFPALHRVWPVLLPRLVARTWWLVSSDSTTAALWGSGGAPAARKRLAGMTAVRTTRSGDGAAKEQDTNSESGPLRTKGVSTSSDPRGTTGMGAQAAWAVRSAAVKVTMALFTDAWAGQFLGGRWASEGWPVFRNALLGIDDPAAFREAGAFGSSAEDEYASQAHTAGGATNASRVGAARLLRIPSVRAALPWLAPDGGPVNLDVAAESTASPSLGAVHTDGAASPAQAAQGNTRLAAAQSFQCVVLDALHALACPLPAPSDKLFRGTSELAAGEVESGKCDEEFHGMFSPQEGGWYLEASPLMKVVDDVLPSVALFLHPAAPLQLQQRAQAVLQRLSLHPGGKAAVTAYFGALKTHISEGNHNTVSSGPRGHWALQASLNALQAARASESGSVAGGSTHPSSLGTGGEAAADVPRQAQATWGWGQLGGTCYTSSARGNAQPSSQPASHVQMMRQAGAHDLAELAGKKEQQTTGTGTGRVQVASVGCSVAPHAAQVASAAVRLLSALRPAQLADMLKVARSQHAF